MIIKSILKNRFIKKITDQRWWGTRQKTTNLPDGGAPDRRRMTSLCWRGVELWPPPGPAPKIQTTLKLKHFYQG